MMFIGMALLSVSFGAGVVAFSEPYQVWLANFDCVESFGEALIRAISVVALAAAMVLGFFFGLAFLGAQ
jgi:hypothetical protein